MSQFVEVGQHWLNLELVMSIELIHAPNDPGKLIGAKVYYRSGTTQDFTDPAAVRQLDVFLRSHRAP